MALEPIERKPLYEAHEPAKGKWATPGVSGRYWWRYRRVGKVAPMEWAIWCVLLLLFELPKPALAMQLRVVGGAVGLRLLVGAAIYLSLWRCPVCARFFSRRHEAGRCEHCGTIFPR